MSSVICFAHGNDREWEAICVDFDIAVQGRTFDEVKSLLDSAVKNYVDDAAEEDEATRRQLLGRRAPWYVSLGLALKLTIYNIRRGRAREAQASFPVPCPA